MRDALYEESAVCQNSASEKRKYTIFHIISIGMIVAAVIYGMLSINFVAFILAQDVSGISKVINCVAWFLPLLSFIGFAILFFKLKRRYNVSFDYLFVQDELRISKVFNEKKRKFQITLKCDQILKIGMCENGSFERTCAGIQGKPRVMTSNTEPAEGKIMIYVLYPSAGGKTVYVLECRKQLLEYLVLAAGRNKWEDK